MLDAHETQSLAHAAVTPGDLVCLEADPHYYYSVILVRDDRCWVRNLESGMDAITSARQCRRVGHETQF